MQTRTLTSAIVVFQSGGGSADAGLSIGTMIRDKGFATAVQSYCHSACAPAWLGGIKRYMSAKAEIGFHGLFNADTGRRSLVTAAVVVGYAARMGLSYDAARWIIARGPDDLNMLTKAEADRLGIGSMSTTRKRQTVRRTPQSDAWTCPSRPSRSCSRIDAIGILRSATGSIRRD